MNEFAAMRTTPAIPFTQERYYYTEWTQKNPNNKTARSLAFLGTDRRCDDAADYPNDYEFHVMNLLCRTVIR